MIKVKTKSKRISNPSFYEYGYHITPESNLNNILENGLLPNDLYDRKGIGASEGKYPKYSIEIAEYLYNGKIPIYFLTTPSQKHLSGKLEFVIRHEKRKMVMLKVNVSKFDQLPDVDFLIMDDIEFEYYKSGPNRTIPSINFQNSGRISLKYNVSNLKTNKLSDIPPKLRKWMEPYDWGIPVTEFKKNHKLTMDLIATTHTFCIAEKIAPKYIEDVWDLK